MKNSQKVQLIASDEVGVSKKLSRKNTPDFSPPNNSIKKMKNIFNLE